MKLSKKTLGGLLLTILAVTAIIYGATQSGTKQPMQNEYWSTLKPGMTFEQLCESPVFSNSTQTDEILVGWPDQQDIIPDTLALAVYVENVTAIRENEGPAKVIQITSQPMPEEMSGAVLSDLIELRKHFTSLYGEGAQAMAPQAELKTLVAGENITIHKWDNGGIQTWILLAKDEQEQFRWKIIFGSGEE